MSYKLDYEQSLSFHRVSPSGGNTRETKMTTRVTYRAAALASRFLACNPLTKSKEKERLLAVQLQANLKYSLSYICEVKYKSKLKLN